MPCAVRSPATRVRIPRGTRSRRRAMGRHQHGERWPRRDAGTGGEFHMVHASEVRLLGGGEGEVVLGQFECLPAAWRRRSGTIGAVRLPMTRCPLPGRSWAEIHEEGRGGGPVEHMGIVQHEGDRLWGVCPDEVDHVRQAGVEIGSDGPHPAAVRASTSPATRWSVCRSCSESWSHVFGASESSTFSARAWARAVGFREACAGARVRRVAARNAAGGRPAGGVGAGVREGRAAEGETEPGRPTCGAR